MKLALFQIIKCAIQTTIEKKSNFQKVILSFIIINMIEYANNGFLDEYYSQSIVAKAEKEPIKVKTFLWFRWIRV